MPSKSFVLGIDTGGTFTDAVSPDGQCLKRPSSRDDPAMVIANVVREMLPERSKAHLHHGTTVATNAVLEHKLARVGLLSNAGFKDVMAIGRQARPDLYVLEPRRPTLPISRELCFEVPGRLGPGGEEWEPFQPATCKQIAKRLKAGGAEALAIVFLHSYADPRHEQAAERALQKAGLDLPITTSSSLIAEFREVERGVCTVYNAGLRPLVGRYLQRLEQELPREIRPFVMTSEGGLIPPSRAAKEPARLLVSGPAGGLVAAKLWADILAEPTVLTLDMGGTSTDVAFLEGDLPRAPDLAIAGHRIRLPSLEIFTVGAGGGSIVKEDRGGAMTVGPESAGADPGPAAGGKGLELTVTDAHLLLGHIDPRFFAGGEAALDPARALPVARKLAKKLKLSLPRLCQGVLDLADVAMARALRAISLERGRDPAGGALLVFGGAGALHGVGLARGMGLRRVLVPPRSGVLSAQGLLWAPPARTRAVTIMEESVPSQAARKKRWRGLVEVLRAEMKSDGQPISKLKFHVGNDLRYAGQSFELELDEGPDLVERFHRAHLQRYGFRDDSRRVEWVGVRVRAEIEPDRVQAGELPKLRRRRRGSLLEPSFSLQPPALRRSSTSEHPVFDREQLMAQDVIDGPALIAGNTESIWLERGSRAKVHPTGALVIDVECKP